MPRLLHICILLSLIPAYVHLNMYTHNPAHRSILLSYYAYTHLPPSSRTLMLGLKYNYISQYILLPLLYEPAVPCYSLMLFLTCTCMYVHVHVCMYVHTYEFPVSLFVFVSYVYSFFHTGLYILCLAHCVLRVLFHIHNHFCSSKKKKIIIIIIRKEKKICVCTHVTVPIAVHIALPMFIYPLSKHINLT